MTTFTQLVQERAGNQPASYYSGSQTTSSGNPLMTKPKAPVILNAASTTPPLSPTKTTTNAPLQGQVSKTYAGPTNPRPLSEKYAKERAETDALKQKVDIIQLSLVMQMLGAQGNQDNDKSKWKIPCGENVTVTGQKWWNLQAEQGGIGAVGLAMHVLNTKYHLAVRWLAKEFGESIDSDDIKASLESMKAVPKKTFSPPPKSDKNISFVKHYLKLVRRIPEKIIDELIAQGRIYADEDRNCVFASDGIAELRASNDQPGAVKKLVPGSTRKHGFIVLPEPALNEMTLAICESSIDAMSYRTIYPGRAAISSAGANRAFPRELAEKAVSNGFKVIAAFDADPAGDKASQALFNHFYLKLWLKHKGQAELGVKFTDEQLFSLLDDNTVVCNLSNRATESGDAESFDDHSGSSDDAGEVDVASGPNLLFFNKSNPFEDLNFKPIILVSIKRNEFGLPVCANVPIEVSQKGYEFITSQTGLTRDRPRGEKDWNEIIKRREAPPPKNSKPS